MWIYIRIPFKNLAFMKSSNAVRSHQGFVITSSNYTRSLAIAFTARRERLPKIAEMDVEMTTLAEMTFKCTSRSSKAGPIES